MNNSATQNRTLLALQVTLWTVCAFHVLVGAGLSLSSQFVDTAASLYGAEVEQWSPQFLYIVRPLGVFMLALGVFAGAAAINPFGHRLTIYVFAGIFIFRALQRVAFGTQISEAYGIASSRNVTNMIFFFVLAALLIVLDQLARRGPVGGNRATTQATA